MVVHAGVPRSRRYMKREDGVLPNDANVFRVGFWGSNYEVVPGLPVNFFDLRGPNIEVGDTSGRYRFVMLDRKAPPITVNGATPPSIFSAGCKVTEKEDGKKIHLLDNNVSKDAIVKIETGSRRIVKFNKPIDHMVGPFKGSPEPIEIGFLSRDREIISREYLYLLHEGDEVFVRAVDDVERVVGYKNGKLTVRLLKRKSSAPSCGPREKPQEARAAVNVILAEREAAGLWKEIAENGDEKFCLHDLIRVAEWSCRENIWRQVGIYLLTFVDVDQALLEHFFKKCPISQEFLALANKMEEFIAEDVADSFQMETTPAFLQRGQRRN